MPNTRFHIGLGMEVLRKHRIANASDFLVGCVFPDAHWLNFSSPAKITIRTKLHYSIDPKNYEITVAGVHEWISEYADAVKSSDFYKGWMLHILLDANCNTLWNAHTKPTMWDTVRLVKDGSYKQMGWESLYKRKWEDAQEASEHLYPSVGTLPDIYGNVSKDCKSAVALFNLYEDALQMIIDEIYRDTKRVIEPTVQTSLPIQQNYDMISLTLNEYMHWTDIISRM